ncbi:hypothetical protein VM1G_05887 [Cytospora mali]|uniref:Uncharacterized protein n=1 Tax=Cytospora mali TaxID=578113 RepID=A0A194W1W8_CYTMA|nr:hypothetical protein VM1G_05887 [Valsa mali]
MCQIERHHYACGNVIEYRYARACKAVCPSSTCDVTDIYHKRSFIHFHGDA